jgi:hypothetical protein
VSDASRVAGSGRTVLACPTPSRKRRQPTRLLSRPPAGEVMHGRLRWLQRLPLVVSRHATASTVPRFQGQDRPPGQATTGTCHEHDQGKQRLRAHAPGSGRASIVPAFRHRHRVARPGQACRRGPLAKGSRVVVVGRIQQRNWTAEDGSARSVVEVVAEELGRACGGRRRPRPGRRGTPARACVTARAGTSTPFQAHRRRSRPVPAWCCSRPQSEAYSRPTLGTNAGPVMRQVRRGGS